MTVEVVAYLGNVRYSSIFDTTTISYGTPPTPTPTPSPCAGTLTAGQQTISRSESTWLTLSITQGTLTGNVTWSTSAGTLSGQGISGATITAPSTGNGTMTITASWHCVGYGMPSTTVTVNIAYTAPILPPPPTATPTPRPPTPTPTPVPPTVTPIPEPTPTPRPTHGPDDPTFRDGREFLESSGEGHIIQLTMMAVAPIIIAIALLLGRVRDKSLILYAAAGSSIIAGFALPLADFGEYWIAALIAVVMIAVWAAAKFMGRPGVE